MKRTLASFAYGIATGLFTALCAWGVDYVAVRIGASDYNRGVLVGAIIATMCDMMITRWKRRQDQP